MMPDQDTLVSLAQPYLSRQEWYQSATAGLSSEPVELVAFDRLEDGPPGFGRLLLSAGDRNIQLLVGWRTPEDFAVALRGRESALIGSVPGEDEQMIVYDALADDALALRLLSIVTDEAESAVRVRHVSTLVSHASLVFDERLFMKCYRVLTLGDRPEVEVMFRLDEIGFNALLAPVARWHEHGFDLALVREFLPDALEGRLLALTSLRDLLAQASSHDDQGSPSAPPRPRAEKDPDRASAQAGGDLAAEMARLGQTTARMHSALAQAFGQSRVDLAPLADALAATIGTNTDASGTVQAIDRREREAGQIVEAIRGLDERDLGRAIRLHGEYHLRRVMRCEVGWIVAGFSDDPLYSAIGSRSSVPARIGSPIEDLADMSFSLSLVANEALAQRPLAGADFAEELAQAWSRRNKLAFMQGYLSIAGASLLLPSDPSVVDLLVSAYELLRERRYDATSRAD